MKKIISFVVLLFMSTSCDPYDDRLRIGNVSEHKIYLMITFTKDDTAWFPDMIRHIGDSGSIISPKEIMKVDMIGSYEQDAKIAPNETTCFWFIKEEFLIKYRDEHIADTSLYVQKVYTNKELQQLNWMVTYP